MLRDLRAQATANEIANRESGQSTVQVEIGTEQPGGESDAGIGQRLLKPRRGQVDDGDRVADQRQRGAHVLERLRIVGYGEMTRLPTRCRAQPRKVNGEPLLQLARTR